MVNFNTFNTHARPIYIYSVYSNSFYFKVFKRCCKPSSCALRNMQSPICNVTNSTMMLLESDDVKRTVQSRFSHFPGLAATQIEATYRYNFGQRLGKGSFGEAAWSGFGSVGSLKKLCSKFQQFGPGRTAPIGKKYMFRRRAFACDLDFPISPCTGRLVLGGPDSREAHRQPDASVCCYIDAVFPKVLECCCRISTRHGVPLHWMAP